MNRPTPDVLPGYEVFERVVNGLHDLKGEFPHLAAFSRNEHVSEHWVRYASEDCRAIPNPNYAGEVLEFEETLKATAPRGNSWIERNTPKPELTEYGPSGLSLYFRVIPEHEPWHMVIAPDWHFGQYKVVSLEIDGPEDSTFARLDESIRGLVWDEIERYKKGHAE